MSKFIFNFAFLFWLISPAFAAPPSVNDLLSSGRVSDAIVELTSRSDAESLNLLSRAYFAMERWDEAVKYGERAVSLEPNNAAYHLWLGREYGRKAQDSKPLAAAANAKKAKNEFERAVQLNPSDVAARLDLAQYYTEAPGLMGGGVDKAREQAAEVAKYDAGNSHLILARVAVKQKQFAEAETQFRAAIRQGHNAADMWLQFADYYRLQGRLDEMQAAVQSAMSQPEKKSESYFDAAVELFLGGRNFPAAMQYVQKYLSSGQLVESAPAFRAHYLGGQLNEKMGQRAAAAAEYQVSYKLASNYAPAKSAVDRMQ